MKRLILIITVMTLLISCEEDEDYSSLPELAAFSETIPSSTFYGDKPYYGMSSTWNGRYITKVARYGNTVYTYVLDNNVEEIEVGKIRLYKKVGDQAWEQGSSVINTCSNPTLLMDNNGYLHVISHISDSPELPDLGGLKHFVVTESGNIDELESEWIVDENTPEIKKFTNRRINASIGPNNQIIVSCGIFEQQVNTFMKVNGEWTLSVAAENLDYNYLYPLIMNEGYENVWLAMEQESPRESLIYLEYKSGTWNNIQMISNHIGEQGESQLAELQQMFLWSNEMHMIIRDDGDQYYLLTSGEKGLERKEIHTRGHYVSFMRSTLVNNQLYLFMLTDDQLLCRKWHGDKIYRLDIDKISGQPTLSIASSRSHALDETEYVDIVLHPGRSENYPNAQGRYVRINKADLSKIK